MEILQDISSMVLSFMGETLSQLSSDSAYRSGFIDAVIWGFIFGLFLFLLNLLAYFRAWITRFFNHVRVPGPTPSTEGLRPITMMAYAALGAAGIVAFVVFAASFVAGAVQG